MRCISQLNVFLSTYVERSTKPNLWLKKNLHKREGDSITTTFATPLAKRGGYYL